MTPKISADEYAARRAKIAALLSPGELALVCSGDELPIWNEINYPFEVERNFYYLTGVDVPGCMLTMYNLNGSVLETLFVPREGDYEATYFGVRDDEFYRSRSGIAKISRMENLGSGFLMMYFTLFGVKTLYSLSGNRALAPWSGENRLIAELRAAYPFMEIKSLADELFRMRAIKSGPEIELIRDAVDVTGRGLTELMRRVRPGMYEYEAQAIYDYTVASAGCIRHGDCAAVQGGQNANRLHYMENRDRLQDGDLLLLDVIACREYYCSDVSRTIPVNGKFTDVQRHWYNVVLECVDMIIAGIRPGESRRGLNTAARAMQRRELLAAGLIPEDQPVNMTTARNWAACNPADHPIGLLAHDVGDSDILLPGMVITVEPGVYLKDLGFGIRIEDDILITETGVINLSAGIPRTADEIEAAMAGSR